MEGVLFPRGRMASAMRRALIVLTTVLVAMGAGGAAFANDPPIGDAGPDQVVCLGEPVMLQGWAEDPDGDAIVEWSWAIESAPEGSLADLPDFMLPDAHFLPDLPGDYVLSLAVSDGADWSLADTVVVSVSEDPRPAETDTIGALSASDPNPASTGTRMLAAWGFNTEGQCNVPAGIPDGITAVAGGTACGCRAPVKPAWEVSSTAEVS